MPDYRYRPRHQPPRRVDRVEIRPGEHLASAFTLMVGVVLLLSTTTASPLLGVYRLHDAIYLAVGVLLTIGAVLALTGIQWPRSTISVGWAVERVGCIVSASGWLAAAVVLTQIQPLMLFGLLVSAFLTLFYFLRFRLLNLVELQARENTGKEAT